MKQSESLKFTVPVSSELHSLAEQFRLHHRNPEKSKQVYLNTLAVSAVNFYLRCMGVETNWSASYNCNPVIQTMLDVADLEIIGLGKVECRPVLSDENLVQIPPEVWSDRIGYVAVQFDRALREATLLGFSKTALSGEIPINQLRSLEELILQLDEIPEKVKQPIHLSQWLMNVVDVGWQTLESLLAQQSELAFRFRCAEHTLAQKEAESTINVEKGRLLDLGQQSESKPIALVVELMFICEQEINICVKVFPVGGQKYLPEELELMVLDHLGTSVMQATARNTKSIQLNFSSELGERFSIKVALGDVNFTEVFIV